MAAEILANQRTQLQMEWQLYSNRKLRMIRNRRKRKNQDQEINRLTIVTMMKKKSKRKERIKK